nr:phage terminase large subunit family protein [Mesorhizobium neociceri]
MFLASTPTVRGLSRIEREYEASDQRRYHVPCPECGGRGAERRAGEKGCSAQRTKVRARSLSGDVGDCR